MSFEYFNHTCCDINFVVSPPIAGVRSILIGKGEYVPTPEQEALGITADVFKDFEPSSLRPTAPVSMRRRLEEAGLTVPSHLMARTAHLAEFRRSPTNGRPKRTGVGTQCRSAAPARQGAGD